MVAVGGFGVAVEVGVRVFVAVGGIAVEVGAAAIVLKPVGGDNGVEDTATTGAFSVAEAIISTVGLAVSNMNGVGVSIPTKGAVTLGRKGMKMTSPTTSKITNTSPAAA